MVQKSKSSSFRSAFRLAPLAASLTAMALVAACARTNPGKATIGDGVPETEEQATTIQVSKALFEVNAAEYHIFDATNMALAARIAGAKLDVANRANGQLDASLGVVMKDAADIMATGKVGFGKLADLKDANDVANAKTRLAVSALCGDKDCVRVTVFITELAVPAAPVPVDPAAAKPDAVDSTTLVPTGAIAVLIFHKAKDKSAALEATAEKAVTPAVVDVNAVENYKFFWSTPRVQGQMRSGTKLGFDEAEAQKTGQPALQPVSVTGDADVSLSKPVDLSKIKVPEIKSDDSASKTAVPKAAAKAPVAKSSVAVAASPKAKSLPLTIQLKPADPVGTIKGQSLPLTVQLKPATTNKKAAKKSVAASTLHRIFI